MMIYKMFKRFAFFIILAVFVFVLTPFATYSGGPEPGPEGDDQYMYEPPPFSGDAQFKLESTGIPGQFELVMVHGILEQLGNSDCTIEVNINDTPTYIRFFPTILESEIPTCKNLHPNDLMGFTSENVTATGCGLIDIEIIATGKLMCMPEPDERPTGATAKLIVMEYEIKP